VGWVGGVPVEADEQGYIELALPARALAAEADDQVPFGHPTDEIGFLNSGGYYVTISRPLQNEPPVAERARQVAGFSPRLRRPRPLVCFCRKPGGAAGAPDSFHRRRAGYRSFFVPGCQGVGPAA
jgi:hypothetical protein